MLLIMMMQLWLHFWLYVSIEISAIVTVLFWNVCLKFMYLFLHNMLLYFCRNLSSYCCSILVEGIYVAMTTLFFSSLCIWGFYETLNWIIKCNPTLLTSWYCTFLPSSKLTTLQKKNINTLNSINSLNLSLYISKDNN